MVTRAVLLTVLVVMSGFAGRALAQGAARATPQAPAPAASASPSLVGRADVGARLYATRTCAWCHGTAAQGGITGPHLAATPRALDAFTRYVRRPAGAMPAFTGTMLADQAVADIHAYLKTLPAAKKADEIPALRALK